MCLRPQLDPASFTAPNRSDRRPFARGAWRPAVLRMGGTETPEEEEKRLRDEMASLLGKSGRDVGMRQMKAPKGSLEALRSRVPKSPSPKPSATAPPQAPQAESVMQAATPPVQRPNPAPEPTYSDFDSLMRGKTPSTSPMQPLPDEVPLPAAVKPSYVVAGDEGTVMLDALAAGDAAPDAWSALETSDGNEVSLGALGDYHFVLVVPEPAHHTAAASDSWTRLLIDLQNKIGSARSDVFVLGVSPESKEVHAKMRKHFGLKFELATDADREFVTAYKVWQPQAADAGVAVDRQSFLIDIASRTLAYVFTKVQVSGHAERVREVLDKLAADADSPRGGTKTLIAPPPRPSGPTDVEPSASPVSPAATSPGPSSPVPELVSPPAVPSSPQSATPPSSPSLNLVSASSATSVPFEGSTDGILPILECCALPSGCASLSQQLRSFLLALSSGGAGWQMMLRHFLAIRK